MNWSDLIHSSRYVLAVGLVLANVAVWYGVWLERDSAPTEIQEKGWRILVRALAAEAAIGLLLFAADTALDITQRNEIGRLELRTATSLNEAGRLGVSFDNLHSFVSGKIGEIRKDEQGLNKALKDLRILQDRVRQITADRTIDNAHFRALILRLKPFANTPVQVAITRDPETQHLALRILDALNAAGWQVQDWRGPGPKLRIEAKPDLAIGEVTFRGGVHCGVFASDAATFDKPCRALAEGIWRAAKIETLFAPWPDDKPPSPDFAGKGVLYILIGRKA